MKTSIGIWGLCLCAVSLSKAADIKVEKAGAEKTSLDLSAVAVRGKEPAAFRTTLVNDLIRSGWFTVVQEGGAIVLRGTCIEDGAGLRARISARNKATTKVFLDRGFSSTPDARRLAHEVADALVKAIIGVPGIASTRIAMIRSNEGRKDVYVCDSDGGNVTPITRDGAVCLSPSWGKGRDTLVYTSYHQGFPDVYRLDLRRRKRMRLSGFPGLNAGADVSPDGRRVALTLSKDGNPDLYILDLRSRRLTPLARTRFAAEASPSWSPDGSRIVFVSDKSGSPQLHVVSRNGRGERQLTWRGAATENVAPDWGVSGRIAYSSKRGGRYQVCLLDPAGKRNWQLTREYLDHEEPSWAPDGRHIVYTRTVGFRSDIYILDTLGDPPLRLTRLAGNWYSPDWSRE